MNDRVDPGDAGPNNDANSISPLPGEPGIPNVAARPRGSMSKKGLLAVGLLILSLVAVSTFSIQRFSSSGKKSDDAESKRVSDRPTAATAEPRKLEMPPSPTASAPAPRIPALVPTAAETTEPIGVRRTGQGSAGNGGPKSIPPEDAPVLLVSSRPGATASPSAPSTRRADLASAAEPGQEADPNDPISATSRNLQGYQRQLQGLLDSLTKTAAMATGQATGAAPIGATSFGLPSVGGPPTVGAPAAPGGLFGGQLQGSATPRIAASMLGNRSLTLPKGTAFTCALKTKVISATSGLVGCQVQRNVFSDDGRVLLIERGSHMDGEYRIGSVRPGTVRIPVLWTRIRTPNGVDLRRRRMSIYVRIPPNRLANARPLLALFFSQMVSLNTQSLPEQDPTLKLQCLLVNDEFTAMGRVGLITSAAAFLAGYNLRLLTVVQAMSQLDAVYGEKEARTFATNHGLQILYAPREQRDANEYSAMLGHFTERATMRGRSRSFSQHGHSSVSRSESEQRRELLLPQEFKELGSERLVVIFENCKPILGEKIRYHRDKVFKARLRPAPAVPRMDMDLHLARVQQRWRYADDELAPGEGFRIEALAHDMALLPDAFEGPPDKTADDLLDFFGQGRPGQGTGGAIEPCADEDGVLSTDDDGVLMDRQAEAPAAPQPEQAGAA